MLLLDDSMNRFRVASRELFNQYFRVVDDPYRRDGAAAEERFAQVETELFEQLVMVPHGIAGEDYGLAQPDIQVALRQGSVAPAMINREIDSGNWDHPVTSVLKDAHLSFVRFFDWDMLGLRDHQYAWVRIEAWPSHPEVAGKHALIEAQYMMYREASPFR